MAANLRPVSIGEIVTSNTDQDVLVAYGLGSCVAVCLYDPVTRVGGMLHALLPSAPDSITGGNGHNPPSAIRFVDRGTRMLIEAVLKQGAQRGTLVAQLCGGAQTMSALGLQDDVLDIGERNVRTARDVLYAENVWIRAHATGGNIGRTARFYIADGRVTVKSLGQGVQVLVLALDAEAQV